MIGGAAAYETAVVLKASELLPAEQLQGPCHRVREQVATDGFMAHFQIDTDFGTFEATGVPQVRNRIAEAEAILEQRERTREARNSAELPFDAAAGERLAS